MVVLGQWFDWVGMGWVYVVKGVGYDIDCGVGLGVLCGSGIKDIGDVIVGIFGYVILDWWCFEVIVECDVYDMYLLFLNCCVKLCDFVLFVGCDC